MRPARVFLYVQHLLGIGHLKRALVIAHSLSAAGIEVTIASGGHDVPLLDRSGLNWVQLPPAGVAGLSFRDLVDAAGAPVDEAWKASRKQALLMAWDRADADLLLIELFPFGRRQMRFELLPLLEVAHARARRPLIVSSIRDVLGGGRSNPDRQLQMLDVFDRYFDHVMVHGDPAFIPLEASFSPAAQLGARLHYTGYVVEHALPMASRHATSDGNDEVLVSAGGGAVGMKLFEAALGARPLSRLAAHRWRLLVGANLPQWEFEQLARAAQGSPAGKVIVERARPDLMSLLSRCAVSVSQAGYNTVLESLSLGTRCVLVPFAGGGEIEQSLRTDLLVQRGWVERVMESELSPDSLAAAVDRASLAPAAPPVQLRLDGASTTVALLQTWLRERR